MKSNQNVLMIGTDLSSNGGIASVVKSLYSAHGSRSRRYKLFLLKTSHYKDKGILSEICIFLMSIIKSIFISINGRVGIFHIHSSARFSFYRKSFFVIIGRILRKKIVFHIHSSDFYDFFLSGNKFIGRVLRLCDCVIVLCEDWHKKLSEKYPDINIIKIENPNSLSVSKNSFIEKKSEKFKVVFVGFLIESKGIRDLVSLARLLKDSDLGDILVQIAGKGELENFVTSSIQDHELQENLEFVGWVAGDLKDDLYRKAHAFILPSYKEGMPISILEAMAWGLPVVSTNIAGTPDIVKDGINGFLFKPGDVSGYFNAITKLAANETLRRTMSANNVERVAENSEEKVFFQVDKLYESLRNR